MTEDMMIKKIELPMKHDERGDLVFMESEHQIPFEIKRVFYLTNLEKDGKRGFHAHKATRQVLFCIKGSALIKFDDGANKSEILISEPNTGVIIENKVWHSMEEFSEDLTMLVIASEHYDEDDYLRDYQEFLKFIK